MVDRVVPRLIGKVYSTVCGHEQIVRVRQRLIELKLRFRVKAQVGIGVSSHLVRRVSEVL